ncbi:MAG: hypothetical protein FWE78_03775 [Methanimicrococcus sp.]|nr:hypothetical protein [Methanimicrococcus sp.]
MADGFTTILTACLIVCGMAVALLSGFIIIVNVSPLNFFSFLIGVIGMMIGFGFIAGASWVLKRA